MRKILGIEADRTLQKLHRLVVAVLDDQALGDVAGKAAVGRVQRPHLGLHRVEVGRAIEQVQRRAAQAQR